MHCGNILYGNHVQKIDKTAYDNQIVQLYCEFRQLNNKLNTQAKLQNKLKHIYKL